MTDLPIKHVVGFSGGIDSQACARWVLNRNDPACESKYGLCE